MNGRDTRIWTEAEDVCRLIRSRYRLGGVVGAVIPTLFHFALLFLPSVTAWGGTGWAPGDHSGAVAGAIAGLIIVLLVLSRHLAVVRLNHKLAQVIEEQERTDARLRLSNKLLHDISGAQRRFLLNDGRQISFDKLLQSILAVTHSQYGFIGELRYTDEGTPYFKTHAISDAPRDAETQACYAAHAPRDLEFFNLENLFGTVLKSGRPLVANQPSRHPRRGGLPSGHPPLEAFLGLPFVLEGEVLGMAGIANRPGGYDDGVVALLDPFVSTCALLIHASRNERHRAQAERALRDNERRLQSIYESAHDGIFLLDPATQSIVDANPRAAEIFGHASEALKGMPLGAVCPDDLEELTRLSDEVGTTGCGFADRLACASAGGRSIPVEITASSLQLQDQMLILAMVRDVSERREAEQLLSESRNMLRLVMDSIPQAIFWKDRQSTYLGCNRIFARVAGFEEPDEIVGKVDQDLPWTREESAWYRECDRRVMETGRAEYNIVESQRTAAGRVAWRNTNKVPLRDADGNVVGILGAFEDITQRKETDAQLRLWAQVFAQSGEAIFITDSQRRVISVNKAYSATTGYQPEDVLGREASLLAAQRQEPAFLRRLWASLEQEGFWQGELRDRRKSGEEYPAWLSISVARDDRDRVVNYICLLSDISERKQAEAQVEHLAHHDVLTGLPNRGLLCDRLEMAVKLAKREGNLVGVLFLDLDRFKTINDSLGHDTGDKLLQQVARRLEGCIRESDFLCRQGGDEFIVVLPKIRGRGDAATVAERILQRLSRPYRGFAHELSSVPSIGISLYPRDGRDIDSLIKNADLAMYACKGKGGNDYEFFNPEMSRRSARRLQMEHGLRRALARNELILHYQPQVSLADGRVSGLEALVRWQHPGEGLLLPGVFMPVAEETHLIGELGKWVLRESCRHNRALQRAGLLEVPVAVNLAAVQFQSEGFCEEVDAILHETGLPPHLLELELTEGLLMRDVATALATMQTLKARGLKIAVDDFGTGYSSLSYLARFPIDKLKIDKSFIHNIDKDSRRLAIVRAIIELGCGLNLHIVAEGVETREEMNRLVREKCLAGQGYLLGRPMPVEALERWLSENTHHHRELGSESLVVL